MSTLPNELVGSVQEKIPETIEICKGCRQEIADQCPTCQQFIRQPPSDKEICQECGQELESDEESDEEGYDFTKHKTGTYRAKCRVCLRKTDECPQCKKLYDDMDKPAKWFNEDEDETDDDEEEKSDGEQEDTTEGSETDEDDTDDQEGDEEESDFKRRKRSRME